MGIEPAVLLGALLVACLAVVAWSAWTLASRVRRAEEDLRRLRGLDLLNDRAATLADAVGRLELGRLEASLQALVEAVPRLERALWRIEEGLARPTAPAGASGTGVFREAIEARLRDLGYHRIQVCDGEGALSEEGGSVVIAVEAARGDVPHKGKVRVKEGAIREVELRPLYGLFP
ncbi:MAG TPA: hypothetical protein VFI25_12640 [Planctomycetota bacterium]|jgi:hypothetical protein|nr:hypothetical protein [Planctomycetota bacterium]